MSLLLAALLTGASSYQTCISGGTSGSSLLSTTECYNYTSGKWEPVPSLNLPQAASNMVTLQLGQDVICLAGKTVICTNGTGGWIPFSSTSFDRSRGTPVYGKGWVGIVGGSDASWEVTTLTPPPVAQQSYTSAWSLSWATQPFPSGALLDAVPFANNGTPCVVGGTLGKTSYCVNNNSNWVIGPSTFYSHVSATAVQQGIVSCVVGGAGNTRIECIGVLGPVFATMNPAVPGVLTNSANVTLFQQGSSSDIPSVLLCGTGGELSGVITATVMCMNFTGLNWVYPSPLTQPRSNHSSWTLGQFSLDVFPPLTTAPSRSPSTLAPTRAPTLSTTQGPSTMAPSTTSPTASPTRPVTVAPTRGPSTATPTFAPSTSAPTPTPLPWWSVQYASTILAGDWSTFQIVPNNGAPAIVDPQWAFVDGAGGIGSGHFPGVNWISTTSLTLRLNPYNFTAGSTYSFQTQVDGVLSPWYTFTVAVRPLVVVVNGGGTDYATNAVVVLDASGSYDPDQPPSATPALQFAWTVNGNCPLLTLLTPLNQPVLQVKSSSVGTCSVDVVVSEPSANKQNNQTISFQFQTIVVCNISISGNQMVAPTDTVRLLATVSDPIGVGRILTTFQWSIQPSFSSAAVSAGCTLPSAVGSINNRALSLPASCIQSSSTYRFTFTVGNDIGQQSQASYDTQVVSPPTGGTCKVSPLQGVALQTVFTVNCTGWVQGTIASVPVSSSSLSYSLGVIAATAPASTDSPNVDTISPPQFSGTFTFTLPVSSSGATFLMATIHGFAGVLTNVALQSVMVTAPVSVNTCSLSPTASLQVLTTMLQQLLLQPSANNCSLQVKKDTWTALWNALNQQLGVGSSSTLGFDDVTLSFLTTSFDVALDSIPITILATVGGSTLPMVNLPKQFNSSLITMVDVFSTNTQSVSVASAVISLGPSIFKYLTGNCDAIDHVSNALAAMARRVTAGGLPSDQATALGQGGLSVNSAFYFSQGASSSSSSSGSSSSSIDLKATEGLLSQGGEISAVTITEYSGVRDPNCRIGSTDTGTVVSSVVDITLSTRQGQLVTVNSVNPGQAFSFRIPLSNTHQCGPVSCAWWDANDTNWNVSGCVGQAIEGDSTAMMCVCTHLTEFSLLLKPATCTTYRGAYLALLALYAAMVLVVLVKIAYRIHLDRRKPMGGSGTLVSQHALIALLGGARMACCALLSSPALQWPLAARAVALVVPYILMFWVYTLMVFQWASVIHFGMTHQDNAFSKVRWTFIVCNIFISGAIIALLSTLGTASAEQTKETVAMSATVTLAAVTFITALAFLAYAVIIFTTLQEKRTAKGSILNKPKDATASAAVSASASVAAPGDPASAIASDTPTFTRRVRLYCIRKSLSIKILLGGLAVSSLLCLESVMHAVTVITPRTPGPVGSPTGGVSADVTEIVLLTADWLAVVVVVIMYHRAMSYDNSSPNSHLSGDRPSRKMGDRSSQINRSHRGSQITQRSSQINPRSSQFNNIDMQTMKPQQQTGEQTGDNENVV